MLLDFPESIVSLNCYELRISESDYRCLSVNGETVNHFISPDTKPTTQKLYVLKDGGEVYYVGMTSQSMSSRLRIGYRADGEHGYHGYKWVGKITKAELLVWCFTHDDSAITEAIEGELVYLIRSQTGKWPIYQMEIHFHNASESERQVAESILEECLHR